MGADGVGRVSLPDCSVGPFEVSHAPCRIEQLGSVSPARPILSDQPQSLGVRRKLDGEPFIGIEVGRDERLHAGCGYQAGDHAAGESLTFTRKNRDFDPERVAVVWAQQTMCKYPSVPSPGVKPRPSVVQTKMGCCRGQSGEVLGSGYFGPRKGG